MTLLRIKPLIKKSEHESVEFYENIFLIKNFITDQELDDLLSLAESIDWKSAAESELPGHNIENMSSAEADAYIDHSQDVPSWANKAAFIEDDNEVLRKIEKRIEGIIPKTYFVNKFENINRYYEGSYMAKHQDNQHDTKGSLKIKYSSVLYLSESDFGGEIFFDELDIKISPPAKSLIIFDSTYSHSVLKVSGNKTRYSLPSYILGK